MKHPTKEASLFVSHFFKSLSKALDMWLHFTLGYHPEGNGQTESNPGAVSMSVLQLSAGQLVWAAATCLICL